MLIFDEAYDTETYVGMSLVFLTEIAATVLQARDRSRQSGKSGRLPKA